MKRFQLQISSQNRDKISTCVKVKLNWDSTVFKQDFQLGTFEVLRKGFLELCKKNKGPLGESEGAHITTFNINQNLDLQYNIIIISWYQLIRAMTAMILVTIWAVAALHSMVALAAITARFAANKTFFPDFSCL